MTPQAQNSFGNILASTSNTGTPNLAMPYTPPSYDLANNQNNLNSAQNTLIQANQAVPQTNGMSAPPQTSWWKRLLPTLGGVAGGIGGGLLGGAVDVATLGAAAPLINPLTLGALGAGLGGAAGKAGENALTGQSVGKDVLASGAENAVGGLVGGGLGAGAEALVGGVSSIAGKGAVDALMQQAPGLLDRDTAQYLINNGITNLSKIADIAPQVTGATGGEGAAFTNGVQNAVDNSDDLISIKGAIANANDPLSNTIMNESTQKNAAAALQRSIDQMTTDSGGSIDQVPKFGASGKPLQDTMSVYQNSSQMDQMTRGAVYKQAQTFLKTASQLSAKASTDQFGNIADPQTAALVDSFNQWGHDLESHALGLGSGDTPLPLSDSDRQALQDGIAALQSTNPSIHATLSDQIDNAENWKDIKSAQAPLVKASQAYNAISGKLNSIPNTTPLEAASSGKMGVLKSILSSPTVKKGETSLYNNVSKVTGNKTATSLIPMLSRVAGITAANAATGSLENPTPPQSTTTMPGAASTQNNGNISTGENLMNDPTMQALHESMSSPLMFNQIGSILPQAQKQVEAQNLISNLVNLYQGAGGAQGTMGGLETRVSALDPGSAAGQYQRSQAAITGLLSQVLGASPQSVAALLPTFTQSPQTANQNIGALQGIFNTPGQSDQGSTPAQAAINNIQNLIQSLKLGNQAGVLSQ